MTAVDENKVESVRKGGREEKGERKGREKRGKRGESGDGKR